jgi:hypothetical protein
MLSRNVTRNSARHHAWLGTWRLLNQAIYRWGRGKSLSLFNKPQNTMLSLQRFPNDFEDLIPEERMGQSAFGRRPTCESCLSIDVPLTLERRRVGEPDAAYRLMT